MGLFRQAVLTTLVVASTVTHPAFGQGGGSVEGQVTLDEGGGPVHGAVVLVVGPGLVALTDTEGAFVIENVPAGVYELLAQREHLTAERQTITVDAGQRAVVNFVLRLSPIHEEVTVTATPGSRATAFEAFNAITTVDSFDIVANPVGTLAAAIEDEPGIGKRGFGPGAGRPIIRGFDGDRVMIMEDGVGTGDLSGQSGDHGVTTDPNGLERIEVVRGPATLLYGSNAVGGVVNAITPHESFRASLVPGTRGQFNFDGGTANEQAGTSASVQHGRGHLTIWASGGARRTDDYSTPEGVVANSATQLSHGRAGLGYFGERFYTSGSVTLENGRNGIPLAGELHGDEEEIADALPEDDLAIGVDSRRRVGRFDLGMRNLTNGIADAYRVSSRASIGSTTRLRRWDRSRASEQRSTIGPTSSGPRQTSARAGRSREPLASGPSIGATPLRVRKSWPLPPNRWHSQRSDMRSWTSDGIASNSVVASNGTRTPCRNARESRTRSTSRHLSPVTGPLLACRRRLASRSTWARTKPWSPT